jgi:hypothetical protein
MLILLVSKDFWNQLLLKYVLLNSNERRKVNLLVLVETQQLKLELMETLIVMNMNKRVLIWFKFMKEENKLNKKNTAVDIKASANYFESMSRAAQMVNQGTQSVVNYAVPPPIPPNSQLPPNDGADT